MQQRKTALTLMFLAVLTSGCIGGTSSTPTGSVTVDSLDVTPTQITSDQSIRAYLELTNTGSLPADVLVGQTGSEILRSYCPDKFDMDESGFSVTSNRQDSLDSDGSLQLNTGDTLRVRWKLDHKGNVPIYGEECTLNFPVPFNYSVSSYRQVQIKEDAQVSGSPKLDSRSSSGPLTVDISTLPGRTGESSTFIADTGSLGEEGARNITLNLQLRNTEPQEQSYTKGIINIDEESLEISVTEPLLLDGKVSEDGDNNGNYYWDSQVSGDQAGSCNVPNGELRLYEGRSAIIRCQVPLPQKAQMDAPSAISGISASVNYTYVKDAGSRTVEVTSNGR